jgi:metallophosphoesterase (TIGR03768 family)
MKKNKIYSSLAIVLILAIQIGCSNNDNDVIPVSNATKTTVDQTIVPKAAPSGSSVAIDDPANFAKNGFGFWDYGTGVPYSKRTDLMLENYNVSGATNEAKLLRFFTFTDVHITDKESPAQAIYFRNELALGGNAISVYAPLMLYTTHALDAAVRTVNNLHNDQAIDFGLTLGDVSNSAQYNELRWFIDIMDGKTINPDSGADDDPIAGPNNDYQDEFDAEGLNSDIPWYATIGNHDHFWIGSKPIEEKLRAAYVGENILRTGNIILDPDAMTKDTYANGVMDGSTLYGTIIGSGVADEMGVIPTVPADANRKPVTKEEFFNEYSNSTTLPNGHGINSPNAFKGCYSFEPKADLPIKVIVLDNTMDDDTPNPYGPIYGFGYLNTERYHWLLDELKAGQAANKLMIIAAHVPIGVAMGTPVGWIPSPGNYSSESDLIRQLQTYPNLILWLAGHRHLNQIKAFPSENNMKPENGFWQVETKSLREFPQEFRTFDILRNSDNTLSIFATDVDIEVTPGSFADISRSYAIASAQIYGLMPPPPVSGPTVDNAELIVPLSPAMQEIIKQFGIPGK